MGICESKNDNTKKKRTRNITNEPKTLKNESYYNYIIADLFIKDDEINKDIRIINSYEEYFRTERFKKVLISEKMNEEQIKKCDIQINGESIPFNYIYKFKDKGKHSIRYSFNHLITKTNYLFFGCSSLININVSNFNTENVTDMECMFLNCSSLTFLDLSSFNTSNVKNMSHMFHGCSSLKNINLSTFDTRNVTLMTCMFENCKSLTNLNLSNFNTQNVLNMVSMFCDCTYLTYLNLSNFNLQNITDIVVDMLDMFEGCYSLKNENIIVSDPKILMHLSIFTR